MRDVRFLLRLLGFAIGLIVGITVVNLLSLLGDSDDTTVALVSMALAIGGIGYLLGPHLSWRIFRDAKTAVAEASTLDIVAVAVGLGFGAITSAALALPLSFLPDPAGTFLPIIAATACCVLSVSIVLMRKRDLIAPWFRRGTTKPAAAPAQVAPAAVPPRPSSKLLLDTNIIIDGRIKSVVETGFLDVTFLVPRFVLDELQYIADSEDPIRRVRGRRGLDTLNQIRTDHPTQVEVIDDLVPDEREVDAKLIRLARKLNCRVLTNDFNLNRVAQIQNVTVLNLNELTNALRPLVLPGEEISIKVVQEGREAGQGVGFLDDGTMVVVDGGRTLVGQQISVSVTRLLQTGAGRMVFASPRLHNGG